MTLASPLVLLLSLADLVNGHVVSMLALSFKLLFLFADLLQLAFHSL